MNSDEQRWTATCGTCKTCPPGTIWHHLAPLPAVHPANQPKLPAHRSAWQSCCEIVTSNWHSKFYRYYRQFSKYSDILADTISDRFPDVLYGYCTYSDILSGTLSDIYSGVFILHCIQHSIWHFYLTYNLTFYLALCGIRSDILSHSAWNFIWHSVQVWRGPESSRARGREAEYRRLARKPAMKLGAWRRGKQGRGGREGGRKGSEGRPSWKKSRDPDLAGAENRMNIKKSIVNSLIWLQHNSKIVLFSEIRTHKSFPQHTEPGEWWKNWFAKGSKRHKNPGTYVLN